MAQTAELQRLPWTCVAPVPREVEDELLTVLFRWRNEVGMMRVQPGWRVDKVSAKCRRLDTPMQTALSLRRHHITANHKGRTGVQLGLGTEEHISGAATEFELAVAQYLDSEGVAYITEAAQAKGSGVLTPDFRFSSPVEIGGQVVHWLEAKQFYGAATIKQDGKSAVGKLCGKAKRYVAQLRPGAIVFAYGCSAELAAQLAADGVLALDAAPLNMARVEAQQAMWCADAAGRILP
ncbi:hypothetical protein T484DRAFT_1817035 [Baffinella frigidus]|nr:hypothetical protein T484DRAFT_1817035 [Cryptophyta sp. CCMP2293]